MNNDDHGAALNLDRFASGRASEIPASDESSLTASIQRGAKAATDAGAQIIAPAGSELPPTQFLGAISYCYAKGVYDSAEIEHEMLRNPELRAATHGNVPGASLIRRFRRLNREAIRATLEEAFRFLRRKAKATACVPLPGQPPSGGNSGSGSFNAEATVAMVRKKAERTLNDAAFVDNMSKE
jgi:hypothetical protein